jgi:hypothetical protein
MRNCPISRLLLPAVSRARRTTKSSVVRGCLEQQLPDKPPPLDLPELPPGESFYDKALPILKKAWARNLTQGMQKVE